MKRTIAFETLGCKLNQYETDSIATTLRQRGFDVVALGSTPADAYVINSCTVTNKADRKSRNILYRAERLAAERAVQTPSDRVAGPPVILTGCFVDSHPDFDRSSRHTTYMVDNRHKNTIPELLEAHFRGETVDEHTLTPDVFGFSTPECIFHTRTNIKIQDGCDNFCTFCIIPRVRGRARSRPRGEILREASEAIAAGSRELILTGVNMSRYRDTTAAGNAAGNAAEGENPAGGSADFVALVEAILELPGEFRLRISSLEPDGLDDRFVTLFEHPRMCPHLHLCLQSGSDRVLLAMRRMYTRAAYRELASKLRAIDPAFHLTTDLIVGFPGETDHDLGESVAAIREHRIGHVHLFPFSVRAGTRAERMPDAVTAAEKRRRINQVQNAAFEEKRRYRSGIVGRTVTVLVEKVEITERGNVGIGLTEYYVPVRFVVESGDGEGKNEKYGLAPPIEPNRFYRVQITGLERYGNDPPLIGRLSVQDAQIPTSMRAATPLS